MFLIGVDHRFQRVGSLGLPSEVTAEFAAALKELVRAHQIQGIAEEMSIDGLGMHKAAGGSVPFFVARGLGLPHLYCDPSRETQQRLGINSGAQRERYWLRELGSFTAYPCLFILGATRVSLRSWSQYVHRGYDLATSLVADVETAHGTAIECDVDFSVVDDLCNGIFIEFLDQVPDTKCEWNDENGGQQTIAQMRIGCGHDFVDQPEMQHAGERADAPRQPVFFFTGKKRIPDEEKQEVAVPQQ